MGTTQLESRFLFAHTSICPARKTPVCPPSGYQSPEAPGGGTLKRGSPGKVRMGLFPEEWFTLFHGKTGVSGPYLFGFLVSNYLISKEIFVMDHEYYIGVSIFIMIVGAVKQFGRDVGRYLDSEVAAVEKELSDSLNSEINLYETIIKHSKDMQTRANGQKMLMDAKKENVAMQLEAAYRERVLQVFNSVRGRMEYHAKRTRVENRVHQKWMLEWILENVRKSITPDFEKQALGRAIEDLAAMAGRA